MKLLRKMIKEDLGKKSQQEIYDLTMEELKYIDKDSLVELLCQTREKIIKEQKQYIQTEMEDEVLEQLKLIQVIKSKDVATSIKEGALDKVVEFFQKHEVILSKELLKESYGLLKYLVHKADARSAYEIGVIMEARAKMVDAMELQPFSSLILRHSKIIDELIKIDAKYGLDFAYKEHLKKAVSGKYGPSMRASISQSGYKIYLSKIYAEHLQDKSLKQLSYSQHPTR